MKQENTSEKGNGWLALSPLFVFFVMYIGLSLIAHDFYKVPITVAFLFTSLYSILIQRGKSFTERFETLAHGACQDGLMLMVWIFILAGAFAASAKAMGAVDSTVNFCLELVPNQFVHAGIFIASCILSLSMGTSVGTIAALTPIAAEIASQTGSSAPLTVAIVVGGAYFGDNLSFISDTTIVATKTQGCKMSDKFRANIAIALPAAILTLCLYFFTANSSHTNVSHHLEQWYLIIPYLFVLIAASTGMNVLVVLAIGTFLGGVIGICNGAFDFFGWLTSMSEGILGMSELIIVTLMAAGMIEIIRQEGGIEFIMNKLSQHIKGSRGAGLSIAAIVFLTNLCTANNTIAILTVGPLAKRISQKFGISPSRSASILDTCSCFAQGIIPYGAQMLIASSIAALNPIHIIPYLYYPFILGIVVLIDIIFIHGNHQEILSPDH